MNAQAQIWRTPYLIVCGRYSEQLYRPSTARMLADRFSRMCELLLEKPDSPLNCFEIMGTVEREQVLQHWTATAVPYPNQLQSYGLFERAAMTNCHSAAVSFYGQILSYNELELLSSQLAAKVAMLPVESIVGLSVQKSTEEVIGMVGIMRAASGYMPLDPTFPAKRLEYIANQATCPMVVVQRRYAHQMIGILSEQSIEVVTIEDQINRPQAGLSAGSRMSSIAYVMFTSGSTGMPKGIAMMHNPYINLIRSLGASWMLSLTARMYYATSYTFAVSVLTIGTVLPTAACLHVMRKESIAMPETLHDGLNREQITCLVLVSSILKQYMESNIANKFPPSLCSLDATGELCKQDLARSVLESNPAINLKIWYGSTEVLSTSRHLYLLKDEFLPSGFASIGSSVPNVQICIFDADRRAGPIAVVGQLSVAGVSQRGYIKRQDLTSQSFTHDEQMNSTLGRLYSTGDRARWLPSGIIEILGRVDFQIKLNGQRIEAGEIEAVIKHVEGVSDSIVALRETNVGTQHLVAYIKSTQRSDQIIQDAASLTKSQLPGYMVPSELIVLAGWPLNTSGKVDRKQLMTLKPSRLSSAAAEEAKWSPDGVRLALLGILRQHAGIEVCEDDALLQSGLTSVTAIRMIRAANKELKCNLKGTAPFNYPT